MRLPATIAFLLAVAAPSVALAGGCPTCTTDADCVPPGGGAGFCVEWSRDFGCGSQRIACCPGQGCDTFSGRPSCEGVDSDGDMVDDCQVLGAAVDAGAPAPDAGPGDVDAGVTPVDAGPPGSDAGVTPGVDAGGGGTDAGPDPMTEGGCSCRASGSSGGAPVALLASLAAIVLVRQRR